LITPLAGFETLAVYKHFNALKQMERQTGFEAEIELFAALDKSSKHLHLQQDIPFPCLCILATVAVARPVTGPPRREALNWKFRDAVHVASLSAFSRIP